MMLNPLTLLTDDQASAPTGTAWPEALTGPHTGADPTQPSSSPGPEVPVHIPVAPLDRKS